MVAFIGQLKQVFRRLGRAPLFAAVILITVAIGVGANTVIFSVVEGVLLKPLPYKAPDRLIGVWYKAPAINIPKINMAEYLYFTDREQSKTLEDIGLYGFLRCGRSETEDCSSPCGPRQRWQCSGRLAAGRRCTQSGCAAHRRSFL